ncbi:MAG: hypothetical protein ACAI38_03680 [Myxococcota bacterium]|nr:hypothetical protein [Myxococcota bacterium]
MKLRYLALVAVLLAPTSAFAVIEPFTGFDTTSSLDYAMRDSGLTLSSHTAELSLRAQWVLLDDAPNLFALRPGFAFGITEDLELGAEAIVLIEPGSDVLFVPRLVFTIIEGSTVDVALSGLLVFDFDDNNDNLLPTRQFGVPIRIKLLDSLSIFTGNNLITWQHVGDDDFIDLNVNVGLGWQMSRDMALRFDTQLLAVNLIGDRESTTISDIFPLGFSLLYGVASRVDITAGATYYAVDGGNDFLALDGGLLARF